MSGGCVEILRWRQKFERNKMYTAAWLVHIISGLGEIKLKRRLFGVNVANNNVHTALYLVRLARIILGLGGRGARAEGRGG